MRCEPGFEALAACLLGRVTVGDGPLPRVSLAGVFQDHGLVRAGSDQRVALAARRKALLSEVGRLEPVAAHAGDLAGLRATAAQRPRLEVEFILG